MKKRPSKEERLKWFDKCLQRMVCESTSFLRACRLEKEENRECPAPNVFYLLMAEDNELRKKYHDFKTIAMEIYMDEIVDIADYAKEDTLIIDGTPILNKEFVARSRIKIDTRKWIAGKIMPYKYGDSTDLRIAELQEQLNELKKALNVG